MCCAAVCSTLCFSALCCSSAAVGQDVPDHHVAIHISSIGVGVASHVLEVGYVSIEPGADEYGFTGSSKENEAAAKIQTSFRKRAALPSSGGSLSIYHGWLALLPLPCLPIMDPLVLLLPPVADSHGQSFSVDDAPF